MAGMIFLTGFIAGQFFLVPGEESEEIPQIIEERRCKVLHLPELVSQLADDIDDVF